MELTYQEVYHTNPIQARTRIVHIYQQTQNSCETARRCYTAPQLVRKWVKRYQWTFLESRTRLRLLVFRRELSTMRVCILGMGWRVGRHMGVVWRWVFSGSEDVGLMPVVLLDNIVLGWSRHGVPAVNDVLAHYRRRVFENRALTVPKPGSGTAPVPSSA
jgi:hypothetical protein